jgi:multidrug resistance efflux pump
MALAVGDRVAPTRGVMSFIVADDIAIIGVFQQNGLEAIKPGASARLVFSNQPGRVYETKVLDIARGIGQGQLAVSGTLARVGSVGITAEYPVRLDIPANIDRDLVRPGMSGTATVLAPNAGVIGTIASILLWVSAYAAYL